MADKKVRLYALSTCPVCKKAANLLESLGVSFQKVEVDMLDSSEQWATMKEVKRYNPEATFPTVVVEEVIVGYKEDAIKKALEP